MKLKLYNTLTRKIEVFEPVSGKKVGFYACGPTVYDFAHIGNFRTYIFEDVLRRTLETAGYDVNFVMNITDVDDKIIRGAAEKGEDIGTFAAKYEKVFFKDLGKLNIKKANAYPRATENIEEIIKLIEKLLKKGVAYKAADGIYFDISKFPGYGNLSGLEKRTLKAGARICADQYNKENPGDFALWKFPPSPKVAAGQVKKEREPSWKASFGEGRPGWHIECSAMSMKFLGETIDIHAGGVDLIFPHHENEIAQSESATGKKFVNFWLESEHLLSLGQKMSKSLNNFFTLGDLEKKGFDPLAFRYLVLTAHWQKQLNFTWESLQAAQNALSSLRQEISSWDEPKFGCAQYEKEFFERLSDNLDTPQALAVLWKLVKSREKASEKHKSILEMDKVLGLGLDKIEPAELPEGAKELIDEREKARKDKNWDKADELRQKLEKMGVEIEDTPEGPKWLLKS
jgi:cysteinyl-tRNA synthetase